MEDIVKTVGQAIAAQLSGLDWVFLLAVVFIIDMVKSSLKSRSWAANHFWLVVSIFGILTGVISFGQAVPIDSPIAILGMIATLTRQLLIGVGLMNAFYRIGVQPLKALTEMWQASAAAKRK